MGAAVALLLALQFPGFWTFEQVPSEPDLTTIELAARRWVWDGPGHLFGISPNTHLGTPTSALPVAGLWFPTTWLAALLPWNVAFILAWFLQAVLFVMGWSLAFRRLGLALVATEAPAMLALASGPVWSFHAVGAMDLASISLTGFVVWSIAGWCAAPTAERASLIGVLLALVYTAGDPLMVPVAAGVGVVVCWSRRPSPRTTALGIFVAGAVCAGLMWPLWVEAAAFFPLSERAPAIPLSAYEKLGFSTPPARLLELVSSHFRLDDDEIRRINAGAMNATDFWYPHLTVGVVTLVFIALGLRRALRCERAYVALGACTVALVFLSFGRWSALAAWAWDAVPPLTHTRFPERLWRHALICALPLVALGLHQLARSSGAQRWIPWGGASLALVELLVQTPVPELMPLPDTPPEFASLQPAARQHRVRLAVDRRLDLRRDPVRFDTRFYGLPMSQVPDSAGSPVLKFVPSEYWPSHTSLQWLGVSHLIMPLVQGERRAVDTTLALGTAQTLGDSGYELRSVEDSSPRQGLLLHRVRAGVPFDRLLPAGPPTETPEGAVPLSQPTVEMEAFLRGLGRSVFLIDDRHVLEGGRLTPGGRAPAERGPHCAKLPPETIPLDIAEDVSFIRARVQSACGGVLSVPWRFLQGWEASVDGAPVPIVAVNSLTLGVTLAPGPHDVELRWRSRGSAQLWMPALTAISVLLQVVVGRVRRRRSP